MQTVCMKVVTSSSVASPKSGGAHTLTQARNSLLFGTLPAKAQNDKIC